MTHKRMCRIRQLAAIGMLGTVLQLGSCKFGEIQTSVTLQSRQVVESLVSSWVLTPLENAVNEGITRLFDALEGNND